MSAEWDRVARELARTREWHEEGDRALRALVSQLRVDPRFDEVEPSVSLSSLQLRWPRATSAVSVFSKGPMRFYVSLVDVVDMVERDTTQVGQDRVVGTILDYLARARPASG